MKELERIKWAQGRSKAIREYVKTLHELQGRFASRGFSGAPGVMFNEMTSLELEAKTSLIDLNVQIMEEAVERELKNLQLGFDIEVRAFQRQFELQKATVLSLLEQETDYLKALDALREAELEDQLTAIELRQLIIITAQTQYALELEDIKREKAQLDLQAIPYEQQVLNKRLLVAQTKLGIIPYIYQVIDAQRLVITAKTEAVAKKGEAIDALIAAIPYKQAAISSQMDAVASQMGTVAKRIEAIEAEQDAIPYLERAMDAEEAALDKEEEALNDETALIDYEEDTIEVLQRVAVVERQVAQRQETEVIPALQSKIEALRGLIDQWVTLIPYLNRKAQAAKNLASTISESIANHIALAQREVSIAGVGVTEAERKVALARMEVELERLRARVDTARTGFELQRANVSMNVANAESDAAVAVKTQREFLTTEEMTALVDEGSDEMNYKRRKADGENALRAIEKDLLIDRADTMEHVAEKHNQAREYQANKASQAQISSELVHLLQ